MFILSSPNPKLDTLFALGGFSRAVIILDRYIDPSVVYVTCSRVTGASHLDYSTNQLHCQCSHKISWYTAVYKEGEFSDISVSRCTSPGRTPVAMGDGAKSLSQLGRSEPLGFRVDQSPATGLGGLYRDLSDCCPIFLDHSSEVLESCLAGSEAKRVLATSLAPSFLPIRRSHCRQTGQCTLPR